VAGAMSAGAGYMVDVARRRPEVLLERPGQHDDRGRPRRSVERRVSKFTGGASKFLRGAAKSAASSVAPG
jgi:hypothetical protein